MIEEQEEPKTIVGVTPVVDEKCRFFLGKDYSNSYEKDFEFIDKFDEGLNNRNNEMREERRD